MTRWLLVLAVLPIAAQTRVDPKQIGANCHAPYTCLDQAQLQAVPGSRTGTLVAAEQLGKSVVVTTSWWTYHPEWGSYDYVGPTCWKDVLSTLPPDNCRVIQFQQCDIGTDTVYTAGHLNCDLTVWFGVDPAGGGCWLGSPISDPTCTLDGTSNTSPGFREYTMLPCSTQPAPAKCPRP